jgi:transcriptional regulator with XRE-family HTH domain
VTFGEKLKILRKEADLSQDDLCKKVGAGDGRQFSRYENGHIMPSAEIIVKIAEVFNVSIDFLLLDDAPRTSLKSPAGNYGELLAKIQSLESLSDEDQRALTHFVDAIAAKNKLKSLASTVH